MAIKSRVGSYSGITGVSPKHLTHTEACRVFYSNLYNGKLKLKPFDKDMCNIFAYKLYVLDRENDSVICIEMGNPACLASLRSVIPNYEPDDSQIRLGWSLLNVFFPTTGAATKSNAGYLRSRFTLLMLQTIFNPPSSNIVNLDERYSWAVGLLNQSGMRHAYLNNLTRSDWHIQLDKFGHLIRTDIDAGAFFTAGVYTRIGIEFNYAKLASELMLKGVPFDHAYAISRMIPVFDDKKFVYDFVLGNNHDILCGHSITSDNIAKLPMLFSEQINEYKNLYCNCFSWGMYEQVSRLFATDLCNRRDTTNMVCEIAKDLGITEREISKRDAVVLGYRIWELKVLPKFKEAM